jgi:hypothetical protein
MLVDHLAGEKDAKIYAPLYLYIRQNRSLSSPRVSLFGLLAEATDYRIRPPIVSSYREKPAPFPVNLLA